jgi:predicted aspartyl protease
MDYTAEIAELLARNGFRRFMMSRTQVGHLKLVGHLDGRPIDIVLDTGASKTLVDLSYCRSEGIVVSDIGQAGAGLWEQVPTSTFTRWMVFG